MSGVTVAGRTSIIIIIMMIGKYFFVKINACLYAKTKRYQSTRFSVSLDLHKNLNPARKKHSLL